tara:strand:- start:146 stop:454 length:309 start_codon:yes stop_codon:yes gene_type:complete
MRLLAQEPNPLNVLDIRELDYIPIHFEKLRLKSELYYGSEKVELIKRWIYNNLSSRFCMVQDLEILDNKIEQIYILGFEDASESSFFSLACPVLASQDIKIV